MAKEQQQTLIDSSTASGPIQCLGITFENDAARREHFLGLLSEKLMDPEFRSIDGFPIGTNEDILKMSDPPYFTACPNPFIEQFIGFHQDSKSGDEDYSRLPFTSDVSEGKKHSIYTAHAYHTKVPHRAIMRYLLHYTNPGDIVFDGFCGTGMTGVATHFCGSKSEIEELGYRVDVDGKVYGEGSDEPISEVGERRSVLNDISPVAAFIASNYNSPVDVNRFVNLAQQILDEVSDEIGWMYETTHTDGQLYRFDYTVWSDVFSCPECQGEIVFVNEGMDHSTGKVLDSFPCPTCGADSKKDKLNLLYSTEVDPVSGLTVEFPRRVPVLIHYRVGKEKHSKEVDDADRELISRVDQQAFNSSVPTFELPDMQMRRVGRMKPARINHLHHFFMRRQAISLGLLWEKADAIEDRSMRDSMLFFVEQAIWGMSLLARYVPTHYSQVNQYLSGVFYVASQIVDVTPWYILNGKLKRLAKAFALLTGTPDSNLVSTCDLADVQLPDNSIDYIFTDPPFGENIYYSDLNILIEAWHRVRTSSDDEVIVDRVKEKTLHDYQRLMQECFSNYYRVLKPGHWMTVEFHNSKNRVWNAIQESLEHSGFVVADVRTLDKKQKSFQQAVSGNTVKRDLIISAYKPSGDVVSKFELTAGSENGVWEFVQMHLEKLPVAVIKKGNMETIAERQSHLIFDRMVAFHVQRGVSVPISSAEFRQGLSQKYPERDEMFFLPGQVQVYDKKRLSANDVEQLQLFIKNEASAVSWVRQELAALPQTFQELQPKFMKDIASWDKYEKPIELLTLLEDNFLLYDGDGDVPSQIHSYLSSNFHDLRNLKKDDSKLIAKATNRWYVPDGKKESDIEKLRLRRLLREFEEYTQSKTKLKVVRSEALRAGFKDCWSRGDYQTIIAVADRVRNDIVQEDPALLMYYDNALMRTED